MRVLGVRVAPTVSSFIVYCTEGGVLVCSDVINMPATLDTPEKLKYVRNNILDILNFYEVDIASIRVTESNSQNMSIDRLYIEAVIQEAFSSSEIKKYFIIRKNGIKTALGINDSQYKSILASKETIKNIDNSSFSSETNEALLAALAAEAKL
ncbi:hypothetical protein [Pragia fontium]|uniref:hypothetical protein n=1 Tax=Pragia fontium TaxID=82985 RepID=UPI000F6D1E67|nr:hypothetical protein [Pragia fontium]VEJ54664.1 Uncharacterised protein [Pragia fontium]